MFVSKVDAAPVFLWSAVEVSIGISVAGILEVQGFEDAFDQLNEDNRPIRLENMDKLNNNYSMTREMGSGR